MDDLKFEVIKFAKKLNSDYLSPLRSGNISHRVEGDKHGFFLHIFFSAFFYALSIFFCALSQQFFVCTFLSELELMRPDVTIQ